MLMILVFLALVPLLSLVSLHWYAATGQRCCLPKAVFLSFSASILWGLLSSCVVSLRPDWAWFPYPLLAAGALLCGTCEWFYCERHRRRLGTSAVLVCFCAVFLLASRILPDPDWARAGDDRQAASSLSHIVGAGR